MNVTRRPALAGSVAVLAGAVAVPLMAAPAAAHGAEVGGSGPTFFLTNTVSTEGTAMHYGRENDKVYVGDWNGDGVDTLAVRRGNPFHISNSRNGGAADAVVGYGRADDQVVVGDWNGDGVDTLAVRRGNVYLIRNSLTSGNAEYEVAYGRADDQVVVGDWNGDGVDTLGVHRGDTFFLKNSIASGDADEVVTFGASGADPISGDWDGAGRDSVGTRSGNVVTMRHLDGRATEVGYGRAGDSVFTGDWDGNGADTLGVRRPTPKPAPVAAAPQAQVQASSRADQAVAVARTKRGATYRYAASGPHAFDCSGFTSWVYRHVGVELPHSSTAQRNWARTHGRQVSAAEARPGDLMWWPGHVAIYAGNGKLVDAANPATGVSERRIYGSPQYFRIV